MTNVNYDVDLLNSIVANESTTSQVLELELKACDCTSCSGCSGYRSGKDI